MQNRGGPLTPRKRFGPRPGPAEDGRATRANGSAPAAIGYRGSLHGMDGDSCR